MNIRKVISFLLIIMLPCFLMAQGIDKFIPPNPSKLVNDYLDVLTPDQEKALEQKLVAFDDSTSNQIAIITIGDIGDYEPDEFAVALGRK